MQFCHLCVSLLVLLLPTTDMVAQVVVGPVYTIQSAVLKEERKYRVYLPKSYTWAKDRKYPVLYVLDGQSHLLHTAASVDYLAAYREIPEMIVVGLDSTVRVRDFSPTDWPEGWIGGGGADHFKRFLSAELIPAIERTYRTDGFRVLSGHSASGLFALVCLTWEPTLFHGYIALSSSLDWDHNWVQRSLEKALQANRNLKAFLYIARSDDTGRPFADYEGLVQMLKTKSPLGLRWSSREYPDETHASIALLAQIDALRQLYRGYRFHNDWIPKGLPYAEKHFQEVSKTVGWPLAIPEDVMNELAYAALSQGKTQDAIGMFKRNVAANPNSARACDSLADGHAKAGQWKEALQAAEKAVALASQFSDPKQSQFLEKARKMKDRLTQAGPSK